MAKIAQSLSLLAQTVPSVGAFFLVGLEGCGKSTLMKAMQEAYPKMGSIGFSAALNAHLNQLEKRNEYAEAVVAARAAMDQRNKTNVKPSIILGALRSAFQKCYEDGLVLIGTDGFPRLPEQAEHAADVVSEFFEQPRMIILEAECPRSIAFDRAIKRGGDTNTPEKITRCHEEYYQRYESMCKEYKRWHAHLKVDTSGSTEQSLANLDDVLSLYVSEQLLRKPVVSSRELATTV